MDGTIAEHVLVFARVVERGSFTAAARALDMPKSTVSRKVLELEAHLSTRLLQRSTRALELTEAGRAFYAHAAQAAAELDAAEAAVQALSSAPRGKLRVTVPLSFAQLGPVFARFMARHPQVDLEVVCTDRVVDLVDERFDIAIRAGALADSRLVARSLGTLRSVVVASRRFMETHPEPKAPAELAQLPALVFGSGPARGEWTLESGGKLARVEPRARMVVNDFELMQAAALDGVGVALIPLTRCAPELARGRLVRVLPDWASRATPVHAVFPSARHLAPKLRAFLEHLREEASGG